MKNVKKMKIRETKICKETNYNQKDEVISTSYSVCYKVLIFGFIPFWKYIKNPNRCYFASMPTWYNNYDEAMEAITKLYSTTVVKTTHSCETTTKPLLTQLVRVPSF